MNKEWPDNYIVMGYDKNKNIVGIEVHYALKRLINIVKEVAKTRRDLNRIHTKNNTHIRSNIDQGM